MTDLRTLDAAATPGPWDIWMEPINGKDDAIKELIEQVHNTDPLIGSLVMLGAAGKCTSITGCGPTSEANAALIVRLRNSVPAILAMMEALEECRDKFEFYASEHWGKAATATTEEDKYAREAKAQTNADMAEIVTQALAAFKEPKP